MGESRVVKDPVGGPTLLSTETCPTHLSSPGFSEFGGTWKSWRVQIKGMVRAGRVSSPQPEGCRCCVPKQGKTPFLLVVLSLVGTEVAYRGPAPLIPIPITQQGRWGDPEKGKFLLEALGMADKGQDPNPRGLGREVGPHRPDPSLLVLQ